MCESSFRGDLTGPNPTDRGKLGTKRHVLTDQHGIPLSVLITAANKHDMKSAAKTLDNIVIIKRRRERILASSSSKTIQNLCLDKGYDSQEIEYEAVKREYIPHIRHRGEEETLLATTKKYNHHTARRWVVERTNSWHNRFRKLLIRYEKKSENYLGLVHLSCCMILYRRIILG
jgi:putative transposase